MWFNQTILFRNLSYIYLIISLVIIISCNNSQSNSENNSSYVSSLQEWHQERIESLKGKNGWLSLVGLLWLEEGENSFGSDPSNDIIFPKERAPEFIGSFILQNEQVRIRIESGVKVLYQGKLVKDMKLRTDTDEEPTVLYSDSLSWFIIKRGGKFAVRLRDSDNPHLLEFKGIETFAIDPAWRIKARFEPYDPPKKISVPTVLGTIREETSPGALVFRINGETYRLDPIAEPNDKHFFVIFADKTNGDETYGAGRFLSVEKPGADGITRIDFNKAYNPPCAFTEFATCPLPPSQNRLRIKVTAGEKKYERTPH